MTDRERILLNIASMLAQEVATLQRLPAVQQYMASQYSLSHIAIEEPGFERPKYNKGDLVLCQSSVGRNENPFVLAFVEANGCKNDPSGLLLRAIGTNDLCDYGNERFARITGIPERMLWEGEKQQFANKLYKTLRKMDTYVHRFRGLSFPEDGQADVTFGEIFGGLSKHSKPYTLRVAYTPKTTLKSIRQQLEAQGFGVRKFEEDDGTYDGQFHNPQAITRESLIGELTGAGIELKPEVAS